MEIPGRVIKRNSLRILIVAGVTMGLSALAGVIIALLTDPGASASKILGWVLLGIILFGMPLTMFFLLPQQPRRTKRPEPH